MPSKDSSPKHWRRLLFLLAALAVASTAWLLTRHGGSSKPSAPTNALQILTDFEARAAAQYWKPELEAQQRLRELSTEEVERRVAHAVLRLANQSGKREDGGIRIDFPISKQDIAEMTGTTLHTVSRILTAWEAAGLVEGGRQKLLVRDPHGLVLLGDGLSPGHL